MVGGTQQSPPMAMAVCTDVSGQSSLNNHKGKASCPWRPRSAPTAGCVVGEPKEKDQNRVSSWGKNAIAEGIRRLNPVLTCK